MLTDKMPIGMLPQPVKHPATAAVIVPPPRLRPKGPVGPGFYQTRQEEAARPKQSAVERLEADKAKYVKSQVALFKQQPVRAPEVRRLPEVWRPPKVQRPLHNPSTPLRPTRKAPTQTKVRPEEVPLDLEHLSSLISDVPDGPQSGTSAGSEDSKAPSSPCNPPAGAPQVKEKPRPPPRPDRCSPAKVRLKTPGPAKSEGPGPFGAPAAGTVRRVDVMPPARPVRTACRPPQYMRQPLQPVPLHSQFLLRSGAANLRLFHLRTAAGSSPLKPVVAPSKPDAPSSPQAETPAPAAPPPPTLLANHPPSPAITRLSSSSSRKRPSLTRSKSDMSDRCSRAGTDLERFFNLCGLDPADLQELTGSSSDIVSLARFRSVSAPGSECGGSGRDNGDEEEDEDAGKAADRVPYSISIIEKNARVIKWLYGVRQAKDNPTKSTNL